MHSSMRSALSTMEGDRDVSLADLDKGLRSTKKGEQIEAVVSFPTLFDKNPFPIMVNSGCLKLADAFDAGDNFTRASILTVLEQSKRHLDKIINVDEFLLRIHKVVHSNDPVARAVTLRTLGACAGILKDKADVHHSIVNALDSHDQIEVEAAIDAAVKFAEQSPNFIMNALPKIASKIHTASVPMKIRFIPILQYVYSNEDATVKVRKLCTDLLSTHPALEMVLPVLGTLTRLSARALFDMTTQVELLLDMLQRDARRSVRAASLHHLASLVRLAPHTVTGRHVQILLSFAVTTSDDALCSVALSILCELAGTCAATVFIDVAGVSRLQDFLFHPNAQVSAKTTELLCELITKRIPGKGNGSASEVAASCGTDLCHVDDLAYAVESLVILAGAENRRPILKMALRSAALLSRIVAIDSIMETCIEAMQCMSDDLKVLTCLFLYQMLPQGQSLVNQRMPSLISESSLLDTAQGSRDRLMVALWTVLLKASSGDPSASRAAASPPAGAAASAAGAATADDMHLLLAHTGALPSPSAVHASPAGSACDGWTTYRIARQAMRHGHTAIAVRLLLHLLPQVSSEVNGFYLTSLWALCSACPTGIQDPDCPGTVQPRDTACAGDSKVLESLSRRILWCEKAYLSARALSSHSASATASPTSSFYQTYVALYMELLQAHNQLQMACGNFTACPPPATAAVQSEQSSAAGTVAHIAPQLKKCEADFKTLADCYRKLRQTMFDADPESLSHIRWLQDCCLLVAHCLDVALRWSAAAGAAATVDHSVAASPLTLAAEQSELRSLWENFALSLRNGAAASCSAGDVIQAVQSLSTKIVDVPLHIPRYVFQRLQHTHLSINIQPAQKAANEPLLVHADSQLVLKVEGVVSCRTKLRKPLRQVTEMRVTVVSRILNQCTSSSTSASHADLYGVPKGVDQATERSMVQMTAVMNDYFSVQFLLSFPSVGTHSVDIICATVDEDGIDWIIGSSAVGSEATTVSVKSYKDQTKQAQASVKPTGSQAS